MTNKSTSIKVPNQLLKLFIDLYNLPQNISGRKVLLYALASSIPTEGLDNFSKDFKLDRKQIEKIINKRNRLTENSTKYFKSIDAKLETLTEKESDNNSEESNAKLDEILNAMYLMLAENYTSPTNYDEVSKYLNSGKIQSLSESIKNYTNK